MMLKTVTSLALVAVLAVSQVAAQQASTQSTGSGPTVEAYDADIGDNTKWYPGGWGYWGYPRYYGWGWGYGRRVWW